nr:MafB family polymorphic toxin [uncultured Kingella sp.]
MNIRQTPPKGSLKQRAARWLAAFAAIAALSPAHAEGNSLPNDPFVRKALATQNFEPGGEYHLFGKLRGPVSDKQNKTVIFPLSSQQYGGVKIEQAQLGGYVRYKAKFSGHTHDEHSPFSSHRSIPGKPHKHGNPLIGFTAYKITASGTELHPADAYDGPQGSGYPAPTGARDEYTYAVSGSAQRVEPVFKDDGRSMWQRIQDRPGNAADTAAKGLSEAWKTATTHNPELDRVGNGLEVVRAGFAGFGSLKDAGMELLGAGDIADLTEAGQSIAAVAALDALPVETLPQALDALDKGAAQWQNIKGAYEEAGKDWAAYKRENPNKAMAAEAAWGMAQDFFGKRVGGKRHADEGKRNTSDRAAHHQTGGQRTSGGNPALPNDPYHPDTVNSRIPTNRSNMQINDILRNSEHGKGTKGKSTQYEKVGTFEDARADFNKLNVQNLENRENGATTGNLPDGRKVNVRPDSSGGEPTLEIQPKLNSKNRIKIRYKTNARKKS